jgi:hypothetical protein
MSYHCPMDKDMMGLIRKGWAIPLGDNRFYPGLFQWMEDGTQSKGLIPMKDDILQGAI